MQKLPVYEEHVKGYKEWKKDRAEKHAQTKALREAKKAEKSK
ncbi:hypothetical protein [Priestia aryabhattai]|nr:hypothetical protein [Priestia aryabhattai]